MAALAALILLPVLQHVRLLLVHKHFGLLLDLVPPDLGLVVPLETTIIIGGDAAFQLAVDFGFQEREHIESCIDPVVIDIIAAGRPLELLGLLLLAVGRLVEGFVLQPQGRLLCYVSN